MVGQVGAQPNVLHLALIHHPSDTSSHLTSHIVERTITCTRCHIRRPAVHLYIHAGPTIPTTERTATTATATDNRSLT